MQPRVLGGEMSEARLDDVGSLDARDDPQRAATPRTAFDVDVEDSLTYPLNQLYFITPSTTATRKGPRSVFLVRETQ